MVFFGENQKQFYFQKISPPLKNQVVASLIHHLTLVPFIMCLRVATLTYAIKHY